MGKIRAKVGNFLELVGNCVKKSDDFRSIEAEQRAERGKHFAKTVVLGEKDFAKTAVSAEINFEDLRIFKEKHFEDLRIFEEKHFEETRKTHKSLDEFCKKYPSRIGERILLYTKDYQKDGIVTCLPVYYSGLM